MISDIVALCALVALLVFQILTPDEALWVLQFGSYYDDRTVCGGRCYFSDRIGKDDKFAYP